MANEEYANSRLTTHELVISIMNGDGTSTTDNSRTQERT